MRIAHLADLHIGYSHLNARANDGRNQILVDFENAAILAAEEIVQQKVDLAVIAGDFLHDTNLYPAALSGAVKLIEIINAADIPLVVIGGNHDEAEGEKRYNALKFLQEHMGIKLFLDQDYFDFNQARLHLVSFRVLSRAERNRGEIKPFEFAQDKANILVTHGYAPGEGVPDIPEGTDVTIPERWLKDPRFELCLLGHIHHHGEIRDHCFFAGSTERRNFGEVNEEPGFYIHTIENNKLVESESILIKDLEGSLPRPMFSFQLDTLNMTPHEVNIEVRKKIEQIPEGAMTRVVLGNVSPELDRSQYRSDWAKLHSSLGGLHFEAKVQTRRVSELLNIEFAQPPEDVVKGFIEYVSGQKFEDQEDTVSLATEIIENARERLISKEEN